MSLGSYLSAGINNALTRVKIAFYLWLIILVLAVVAIFPINSIIRSNLGHFLSVSPLKMPFEFHLVEVFLANQAFFSPYFSFLFIFFLLFLFLSIFLNAGLIPQTISRMEKVTFKGLMNDACRYFWPFFLSLLLSLPILLIMMIAFRILSFPLNLWSQKAVTEWPVIIASNLRMLLFILIWTAFRVFLDIIRIIIIQEGKKVLPAFKAAIIFLKRKFISLWAIYLLLGLMLIIISSIFLAIGNALSSNRMLGILSLIIIGQLYVFFRLLIRLTVISVENYYYLAER